MTTEWLTELRNPKLWVAWVGTYETGGFKPLGAHPDVESARVYAEAFHPGYGQIVQVAGDES